MSEQLLALLLAIAFSLALTPISRRLALRIGAVDTPGERRVHAMATPRLGGPAILAALLMALCSSALLDRDGGAMLHSDLGRLSSLAIGALMVMMVGAIDDVHALRPLTKLAVETAAAAIVVHGGYRIDPSWVANAGAVSFAVSVFFIVTTVNAINLVDGLDGLAAGLCLMMSATLLLLCLLRDSSAQTLMLDALCGALIGFLPYNFHPARIFLGDSGALLLGFMLGATAISTSHAVKGVDAIIAPLLVLGLPLSELILTATRRLVGAQHKTSPEQHLARYRYLFKRLGRIFAADRDHIHHRLLGFGISHPRAVLALYGVAAFFCGVALALPHLSDVFVELLLTIVVVASVGAMRWLGYTELIPNLSSLLPSSETSAMRRRVVLVPSDGPSESAEPTTVAAAPIDSADLHTD